METTLTLQQKMDILTKDFLERDGDRFVRIRKSDRLGWESTIPEDGAYSEFALHVESQEDLIKNAYRMASDMITVMNTPFRVRVAVTNSQSSTDSKTVYVATEVFDNPDLPVGKKLDTFIGLAVHEGCHLVWTDFGEAGASSNKIVHSLQNIIEDERIERECGESKPGLANFLAAAKYYYFDLYRKQMEAAGQMSGLDTFTRLMNTILSYVRYPKALDPADLEEFADTMLGVREALLPYPQSTAESTAAAEKIYELMKQYIQQNGNRSQKPGPSGGQEGGDGQDGQQDGSRDGASEADGDGGSGKGARKQKGSGGGKGEPKKEKKEKKGKKAGQSGEGDEGQEPGGGDRCDGGNGEVDGSGSQEDAGHGRGMSAQEAERSMEDSSRKMETAMKNIVQDPQQCLDESQMSQTVKNDGGRCGQYIEGTLERGLAKGSYIYRSTANEDVYRDALARVKPHIAAIGRTLRLSSTEYKTSMRGMRSGALDTSKLAEAFQGVPTVYMREGEVRTDKVAVCILIDESGSMWGCGETAARDTAVLLNEALSGVPNVDLYIYGHTATTKTTELFVYRERGFRLKYALGSTDSRAGNHDSVAIREACARVRRFTKEKCLFFMISDGAPNETTDMVRKAVKDVERDGFSVVAISIDPYYDPSTMYDRNVTLSDLQTLAPELGKLVKKAVLDNTKKKMSA